MTRTRTRTYFTVSAAALVALTLTASPVLAKSPPKPGPASAVLFWSQAQKESGFQAMEDYFAVHTAKRGKQVHPLPQGKPLDFTIDLGPGPISLDAYMAQEKTAGLLVLQDGKVRLEKYTLGYGPDRRWTTFSVAKSVTSTLVGAAVKDGYIKSVDDPVVRYIPGLKGSAYDKVSIRQVLTMTSGVKWNEDYTDPKSDVAQLFTATPDPGVDATVSYMRKLPQEAAPGTKWVYKTGETNLIGVLVTSATHKSLARYMSEKIWQPYGMEKDAVWMIDDRGQEAGGCCLSMTLRDYGRLGEFMRGGAMAGGRPVLPKGWIEIATTKQADTGEPGHGYGYQWWTNDDGTYDGFGIFGQRLHIDAARKLVIVISSAWPEATSRVRGATREKLIMAVVAAVDAGR
ncbi:MAG: serine hydrolase [Phenylobacterium zucineum]|nr:MAG: serine hydrolase [Phenylobacterium zucineum]